MSTKNNILNVASNLFSKEGYVATSINNIAKESKVAKPSIYYFFKNKQDLYFQVLLNAFQELDTSLCKEIKKNIDIETKMKNIIVIYLEFGLKNKTIFTIAFQKIPLSETEIAQFVLHLRSQIIEHFEKLLQEGIKKNVFVAKNTTFTISLLIGTMNNFLIEEIFYQKKSDSLDIFAQRLVDVFSCKHYNNIGIS